MTLELAGFRYALRLRSIKFNKAANIPALLDDTTIR
jgi:hypothetical protein